MRKDTILKKKNISSIEEIPKLSAIFRKLSQVNIILHGKSVGHPTHKFQHVLRSALAERVKTDIFENLKEVTCQNAISVI